MAEDKKLTVTVKLGITLPVGEIGFVKPEITISDIDPSADVDAQIRSGLNTAIKAMTEIDGELDVIISQILAPETGSPGMKDRLKVVEGYQATSKKNFANIKKKIDEESASNTKWRKAVAKKLGITENDVDGGES